MRVLPDKLTTEWIDGRPVVRDEAGYLVDLEIWNDEIAGHIAAEEGVSLTEEHWTVIRFMRDYLDQHCIAADARFVFRHLGARDGSGPAVGRTRFFELFPYGYVKQACKNSKPAQWPSWAMRLLSEISCPT